MIISHLFLESNWTDCILFNKGIQVASSWKFKKHIKRHSRGKKLSPFIVLSFPAVALLWPGVIFSERFIYVDKLHVIQLDWKLCLIFWRGLSTIHSKPMCLIVLHKTDATTLDLIWLKIACQNDRKVLQFVHLPAFEAHFPSKDTKCHWILVKWHKNNLLQEKIDREDILWTHLQNGFFQSFSGLFI